jgi:acetyl esterase/lipase
VSSGARARIARAALVSNVITAILRLVRGPARPTWSFRFEALARTLRRFLRASAKRSATELRASWEELAFRAVRGVSRERMMIGTLGAEWFSPEGAGEGVLLYFHGGAYVWGSSDTHADLVSRLARDAGVRALVPNYRLAPEHPCPAAHEDAEAAYRWLLERGVAPSRVVVGGDSAGGNLALSLLVRVRAAGLPMPGGAALLCPWVDLGGKGGSMEANLRYDWISSAAIGPWVRAYHPHGSLSDPIVSPLYADLRGLPRTLVQVGGAEVLRDQIVDLAGRLARAGVEVTLREHPDMFHVWQMYAGPFPELRGALQEIAAFVADHQRTSGGGEAGLANR